MSEEKTVLLTIEGMGCSGCVDTIREALSALVGVNTVEVDLESGRAEVKYNPGETGRHEMIAAVEEAGYSAE